MIIIVRACWNNYVKEEICIFKNNSGAFTQISKTYKVSVTKYLIKRLQIKPCSRARLKIVMHPGKHIIDSKWCDIVNRLCYEKRELHTAMAWLSTLGGAFSALGDISSDCAFMAGRISVQQLKIALKLGDPPTVARCRLFYALSIIQCGKLKQARDLIKVVYQTAVTQYPGDKRLQRMCHGIWNKLRYEWGKKYKRKYLKI